MGDVKREPGETHTLLKPMQERVDELSKTQSEMMRMQREMMGVMLSLSLRLDSALGKSKDEGSTPQKSRSVIDLTADEAQASNSNKGKGKAVEQDGQTGKGESNADVLKAVAALSAHLDKVGSNVDSLSKSIRVLERNATGAAAAKPPVVEPVPGPSRPAAVVSRPAAQPAPPVQTTTPVANVAPILAPAGSQDKNSEPGPAPFGTLRPFPHPTVKRTTTHASDIITVETPEGSRKRRRVTFDSEDEVEFLAVGCT
ncbi:hypothetical protein CPC08DRAFT_706429 [Agrocybe pediades]|nr:hypothetical protein CPC08DRAFT_706429 [Agrocybe pediades]